jgi:cytochrome c
MIANAPNPDSTEIYTMIKLMTAASAALLVMSGAASADQALAQKNACMSCHGVDKKIVGPAFKEVAKKYEGDATAKDKLVAKVKTGGKGVWGAIPMPPNPNLKKEDAEKIVDWLLSLK